MDKYAFELVPWSTAQAAQHPDPDSTHGRSLNKVIKQAMETKEQALKFVKPNPRSLFIGVFIDAAFANNPAFLNTLMDDSGNCNIIHYGSIKCRRVARSALSSELYPMVLGFDQSNVLKKVLELFLDHEVPLKIYTDSQSLVDSLTTFNTTTEKMLLIDLSMLCESYEKR